MKKLKPLAQAHTPRSSKGMGDFYGTAIKQKMGKMREVMGTKSLTKKNIGKPPKTLA